MADAIRAFTAMVAAFDAGAIFVVLATYLRAWRRTPAGYRMLPRHVVEVSLASLLLLVGVGLGVYDTVGQPQLAWRIPVLYLPALLIFAVAMVDVGRLQRQRLATTPRPAPPPPPGDDAGRHHWKEET